VHDERLLRGESLNPVNRAQQRHGISSHTWCKR
jgi:hypothetical protein